MKILEYKNKNYFPFSSISFVHTHTSQKETDDRLSVLVLFLKNTFGPRPKGIRGEPVPPTFYL
jgi:hypothetical protein